MRKHNVLAKVLIVVVVSLVLLVPLLLLQGVVTERALRKEETESEIMQSWGGKQTLAGPFLTVPFLSHSVDANGKRVDTLNAAHFLPETLVIDGTLAPETRARGMYAVTVYGARLSVRGTFGQHDFGGLRVNAGDIFWGQAFLSMEVPDMRSLQERASLEWGKETVPFHSGKGSIGMFAGEMRAEIPRTRAARAGDAAIPFSFDLSLHGGDSVSFLPLGDVTHVHLRSTWPSPNFNGSFLPVSHTVGPGGFEADWNVISTARAYPQRWTDGEIEPQALLGTGFGVSLMTPVDTYQKVTRALKYGLLFLVLPFCTLFLFEVFMRKRVHPMQYLLVGLGDCVFYFLLLSLAEHMSFGLAYLAGAAACTVLLTLYARAIVKSWKGVLMLPVLGAAYGFLALVLSSEDNALLMGALGLFVLLAAAMFITRRVDWYRRDRIAAGGSPID